MRDFDSIRSAFQPQHHHQPFSQRPSATTMSFDLPPHLQTLNSIPTSSPPTGIDAEQEDAFWGYMHTDDLFRNFGFVPSPNELEKKQLHGEEADAGAVVDVSAGRALKQQEQQQQAPTPVAQPSQSTPSTSASAGATLESFLAAFANEPTSYLYTTPSTAAPTPAGGVSTHDILRASLATPEDEDDEDGDKPSGAKKLKSMGAGQNEIEEE